MVVYIGLLASCHIFILNFGVPLGGHRKNVASFFFPRSFVADLRCFQLFKIGMKSSYRCRLRFDIKKLTNLLWFYCNKRVAAGINGDFAGERSRVAEFFDQRHVGRCQQHDRIAGRLLTSHEVKTNVQGLDLAMFKAHRSLVGAVEIQGILINWLVLDPDPVGSWSPGSKPGFDPYFPQNNFQKLFRDCQFYFKFSFN